LTCRFLTAFFQPRDFSLGKSNRLSFLFLLSASPPRDGSRIPSPDFESLSRSPPPLSLHSRKNTRDPYWRQFFFSFPQSWAFSPHSPLAKENLAPACFCSELCLFYGILGVVPTSFSTAWTVRSRLTVVSPLCFRGPRIFSSLFLSFRISLV